MHTLRIFSILAWIAMPTVMYSGYTLLGMLTLGGLSVFQQTYFRAGHTHLSGGTFGNCIRGKKTKRKDEQ